MENSQKKRIEELVKEEISIVPYSSDWPNLFRAEKEYLKSKLPIGLVKRIEHFGSTAVPGLSAKPIIDILVEISSQEKTKTEIVPVLISEGYEYFWRPINDDLKSAHYAWFIKRNLHGLRTHHIHTALPDSQLWERLLFRDYLIEFPDVMRQYEELKRKLSKEHPNDRVLYTKGKTGFIASITEKAKKHYKKMH
jgi:GrpB-like predicted nucleotidyltransferase (UPF0157 family)